MFETTEAELAKIGARLIDDAYLAWVGAESEAEAKLHEWFQATGGQREAAYLAYRAALEREEASARDLERLSHLASTWHDVLVEKSEQVPN
jgi:hypothetical protein